MKAKIQKNKCISCSVSQGSTISGSINPSENICAETEKPENICANSTQRGAQGIPGEAATIQLGTVTTGEPGTNVSITNSGNEHAAIFNFVIPGSYDIDGSALIDVNKNGFDITITSKTYTFEQGIASDTWVIQHNLNKRPSVFVVDSANCVQLPDEIVYDSDNQVTVQFISAFAGKAYLN